MGSSGTMCLAFSELPSSVRWADPSHMVLNTPFSIAHCLKVFFYFCFSVLFVFFMCFVLQDSNVQIAKTFLQFCFCIFLLLHLLSCRTLMSRWLEWSGRKEWTWGVQCPELVSHLTLSCFYPPCVFFISWVDLANFGCFYLSKPWKICSHPQNGIKYALSSGPRGCVWSFVGRQNFLFSSHNFETIPLAMATLATFFINHFCKKQNYYCQPTELLNTLETFCIFTHVYIYPPSSMLPHVLERA